MTWKFPNRRRTAPPRKLDAESVLCARNDASGSATDWWFAYKLPEGAIPPKGATIRSGKTTGYEYLYLDADTSGPLTLSPHRLDTPDGALYQTLLPLYQAAEAGTNSIGWIFYNDEIPGAKDNNGELGHTKGVLAFDLVTQSAFWLLHSTPRYPLVDRPDFPEDERIYGQTYLCITLDGLDTARALARVMCHQHEPQTYGCRIPAALAKDDPLRQLATHVSASEKDPPVDMTFRSKAGQEFRLLAKNRHWNQDFWIDWVGPRLSADLDIETWRRGTLPGTQDSDQKDHVRDVLYVDLSPLGVSYEWHYTKDHAKWAASEEEHWVCVADINRQVSQEKRGGGTIALQHPGLHGSLSQIEKYQP